MMILRFKTDLKTDLYLLKLAAGGTWYFSVVPSLRDHSAEKYYFYLPLTYPPLFLYLGLANINF